MKRGLVLLLILLLAGCAHNRTHRTGNAPESRSGAPAGAETGSGVRDNIHLPQSRRYAREHDSGPAGSGTELEQVARLHEPVPQREPLSRYGNGPVYSVRGKTYRVLASARGYRAQGIASWYGEKFHGHLTSSLEPYDMYKFTAAHTTLPLPSYARVTNLDNGRSVIVRINDRGPFHDNRLIDLSWAAAVRLGIWEKGTGVVDVQAIDPEHPQELPAAVAVTAGDFKPALYLQVGAYADAGNAQRMLARLRGMGVAGVSTQRVRSGTQELTRVRIGPLEGVDAVDRLSRTLKQHGIASAQVEIQPSSEE